MNFRIFGLFAISLMISASCATITGGDSCKALDVQMPELIKAEWDVPVPEIEDEFGDLTYFYKQSAALLRGMRREPIRIAVYGDSNMTYDYISGELRRSLQLMYGDSGHGFVASGRPWSWYEHRNVIHDVDDGWISYTVSTNRAADQRYGFSGISAHSIRPGAITYVETAPMGSPVGTKVSKLELYYMKQPQYGSFDIRVDGKVLHTIDSYSEVDQPAVFRFTISDGPHRIEFVAGPKPVRLFGVAMERYQPGFVVDSLGVGALNSFMQVKQDRDVFVKTLRERNYDLVIFTIGANMWNAGGHPIWMKEMIDRHREALPGRSILLTSPPSYVDHLTDTQNHWHIKQVRIEKQSISKVNKTAYFDLQTAMGGEAVIVQYYRKGWAQWNLVHLREEGGAYLGRRIHYALWAGLKKYLETNPEAGCQLKK
ncbi:MAG: hypothetical protein H3C43_01065 [Leptonema sp. (in: Bacteria)]|nr:hypothetical protein [Leptonema sp. (in: bacteria)]